MQAQELLDQFVQEARECLEQVGDALLQVERHPNDAALLNNLFRLVHTLKGNCGLFDFKPLEVVVHAGEDVLDLVRSGKLHYSEAMADALLAAMDLAAQLVYQIERTGVIAESAMEQATAVALQLRALMTVQSDVAKILQPEAVGEPDNLWLNVPAWLQLIPQEVLQANPQSIAWRYLPEATCFFKGEDPWLYACQSPQVVHVQVQAAQAWPEDLAEWDCYACNLEVIGLSQATRAELEEHFRYVPEQVEIFEVELPVEGGVSQAPNAPLDRQSDALGGGLSDAVLQAAHQMWQAQCNLLQQAKVAAGTVKSTRSVLGSILKVLADEQALACLQSLNALPANLTAEQLLHWTQMQHVDAFAEFSAQQSIARPAVGSMQGATVVAVPEEAIQHKQLKVSQEKIDRLMDLIGEMVVAKNALPYLAQRAEAVFQQRELAREIKAQYAVINRIAEDMQHAIMQVRMMPVGAVFQRFARLVRDTSKKLGKDVQLVIEGEDTEADKNIIESLADPLIHILRNSLDHGIELPAVRQLAGKPVRGTISVRARQESDRVLIEIADDGAGISAQRVRTKAIERGLIPEDKAHTLSDAEAIQLIFLPGFSTAEQISDLSGRGVGMDVVRSAVERINGQVELSSQAGQGTQIHLSLPLSMAVTNVMIVEVGGRRFGVPMDWIVETVRVHVDDIHHFKQSSTTVLRGKIVPLRALHTMLELGCAPQPNSDHELAVLVVRLGDEHLGLLVDQFHGASDIILKPLEGVLSGLPGFAGTALMGDGSVLMVLNPKELC